MVLQLEGTNVLVTGAGQGLGFAREGANVAFPASVWKEPRP